MVFKMRVLSLAVAQVVATGALSMLDVNPAMAQQAGDAGQAPIQRVEVTGSNIRRVDTETPDPVQVISAQELKNSGYTSINDVLQHITANGAGTLNQSFTGGFAAGGSAISLRGLNDNATLTLIDGHRMASYPLPDDGSRSFVDLSNIPFEAVERIEILKDGASAVYGSDAMAGVVNIILKKNVIGTTVSAETGTSTEGGGKTSHATITHGAGDFATDGYNAYISAEYRHQDPIYFSQRAGDGLWNSMNFAPYGGVNNTLGVPTAQTSHPVTLSPYLTNPNVTSLINGVPNPAAYAFYSGSACGSYSQFSSGGCSFISPWSTIQPETSNLNLLGSMTKKLPGDWQIDLKASMFQSKDDLPQGMNGVPGSFSPYIVFGAGVVPHFGGTTIPSIEVPANYPGNTFGVAARVRGYLPYAPERDLTTDSKAYRLVADLTGTLAGWDIDASVGYTKINLGINQAGNENVVALNAALNRAVNPMLLNAPISAADRAAIFSNYTLFDSSELDFTEVHASRSLAQLPGGDFAISTGAEYIHRDTYSPGTSGWCGDGTLGCSSSYVMGSQVNSAAYAEFVAPVLKTLEIDGAVRYDHISGSGGAATPKLAFKYTPSKELALRGSVSKGFRAPGPAESGNSATIGGVGNAADPVLCPGGIPATGNIAKGSVIAACNQSLISLSSTNPNLQPEKSTSVTLGAIIEPVRGWSSSLDLYSITIKDQIVGGPTGPSSGNTPVRNTAVPELCADGNGGTYECTPAVGLIAYYPATNINSNQTQTKGLEFDTRYRFNLGDFGKLTTDFQYAHAFSYVMLINGTPYELAGTHGPGGPNDDSGNPKNRAQFNLTWDKGPLQVATTLHWTSGFNTTDETIGIYDCATSGTVGGWFPAGNTPSQFCHVGSFMETDLSVQYKLDKQWTFHASVSNLFNQAPPVDVNTYGSGRPYDLALALPGAIGRFVNAGAVYKF